jgi:thiamine-monophosphate kinase
MPREYELIARLARIIPAHTGLAPRARVPAGIGDDAAVLRPRAGYDWVVSTDALVEGAHFLSALHPADAVGFKALARASSDLAAMGAAPLYFLLTLSLPAAKTGAWLNKFAYGMARAARRFGMRLVGGDLSRHDAVCAAVTVIGEARRGLTLLRSGAGPGDVLFVSGRLGAAQAGLEWLKREGPRAAARRPLPLALRSHLYPEPRLALGRWLAQMKLATAAIDLSDGLSIDLPRFCSASGIGAVLHADAIPLGGRLPTRNNRERALGRALHGGEDYELLFSVPRRFASRIPPRFRGVPLTRIGEITPRRSEVLLEASGQTTTLRPLGWDHFRKDA